MHSKYILWADWTSHNLNSHSSHDFFWAVQTPRLQDWTITKLIMGKAMGNGRKIPSYYCKKKTNLRHHSTPPTVFLYDTQILTAIFNPPSYFHPKTSAAIFGSSEKRQGNNRNFSRLQGIDGWLAPEDHDKNMCVSLVLSRNMEDNGCKVTTKPARFMKLRWPEGRDVTVGNSTMRRIFHQEVAPPEVQRRAFQPSKTPWNLAPLSKKGSSYNHLLVRIYAKHC